MLHTLLQLHPLRALRRTLAAALTLALLSACAAPFDASDALGDGLPARAAVVDVPLIKQADFYCGPASLAMVMQWAGAEITQEEIASLSFTPGAEGTYLADMIGASRRLGWAATEVATWEDLRQEVAAGHPVIVFQNLGVAIAPVWHYGVVTGFDQAANVVTLNSGQLEEMRLPVDIFARTWARGDYWGLVVLPPDQLAATATQTELLAAGAALERAGQAAAAETFYETGHARWPDNWLWLFGLANTRYAMGDLKGAERALLQARALAPDVPEIRANLAHVRAEARR